MSVKGPSLKINPLKPEDKTNLLKKAVGRHLSQNMTRLATIILILIIFSLTIFTLWVASTNFQAVQEVQKTTRLNNLFEHAHYAVSEVESLERKYRLEPSPEVKSRHMAAVLEVVATLNQVRTVGTAADQALVDEVLLDTQRYVESIERMFAAVDTNNAALVIKIDSEEVDPLFNKIAESVSQAAQDHATQAEVYLGKLANTQLFIFVVTPIVFLLGLGLIVFYGLLLKTYRRQMLKDKFVNEELQAANLFITRALEEEKELGELKSRFVTI